jgi:hypothetical protein
MYSVFVRYNSSLADSSVYSENLTECYIGSFSTRVAAKEAAESVDITKYKYYEVYREEYDGVDIEWDTFVFVFEHEIDVLLNLEKVSIAADRVSREKKVAWDSSLLGISHFARMTEQKTAYQELSEQIRIANCKINALDDAANIAKNENTLKKYNAKSA